MWPHQVALPACGCLCHNFLTMHVFCHDEELIVVVHALPFLCHNDVDMTVFCSPSASTPRNSASAHCSAAFSNNFVASTGHQPNGTQATAPRGQKPALWRCFSISRDSRIAFVDCSTRASMPSMLPRILKISTKLL